MAIIGIVTNIGVDKIRDAANNEGFYIYPTHFGVSRTRGILDPNRTTANSGLWFTGLVSSRVLVSNNTVKFICTIPVGAIPPAQIDYVREIYLYGRDSLNNEFIFSIGQTTQDIIYDPTASVTLELEVSLTNVDLSSTIVFQYTQATELSEHETDPNAHAEIIAAMNKAGIFLRTGGAPFAYAGQTFDEKAEFAGTPATATVGLLTFEAQHNGSQGNAITLDFDGVKTVDQVIVAWNAANPTNGVDLVAGDGNTVLPTGTTILSGGTYLVGHNRLVYRDTDGFYKQALADGSIKSRVAGMADIVNRIVRSAGFVNYTSGFPVGTELYLSPTSAGTFTDVPSEVKVALVTATNVILLSSFGGGSAVAGQNFDTIVTDTPGYKKYPTTQEAIDNTPDTGFILIDKNEPLSAELDLQGKALNFVFNGARTGWFRYLGQVEEIQIAFSAVPTSGTWRIEWNAQETADFAYNADANAVETAFNLLTGHAGVIVTGNYTSGFLITFSGTGAYPLPTFASVGVDEVQRIDLGDTPDDGTIRLSINGEETINIPWNSTTAEVAGWIEDLPGVSDVTVVGSFALKYFQITYVNADGKKPWPQIVVANNSLTKASVPVTATPSTTTEGRYPASNLRAGVSPVVITPTLLQGGVPVGPTTLLQVAKDNTRFLGQGVISDFLNGIDLNGFKNVDIEVVFDGVTNPIINTAGTVKPKEVHRLKSFGMGDRNQIVVGNAVNPGEYNDLVGAIAAASAGDRLLVIADQSITSSLSVSKNIEIEFINDARLIVNAPIAGTALSFAGYVRTKHMHVYVSQTGSYDKIVEFSGHAGWHADFYVECSGNGVNVSKAFSIAAGTTGLYVDGVIQIGTSTVTNVLSNDSGWIHNVVIRDRSNGIVHDTNNRRPPIQEQLTGTVDGVNDEFELSEIPASIDSVLVMVDSVPRFRGIHYTIANTTITFLPTSIPQIGQDVFAYYLPTGLIQAAPTEKAGAIEAISSGGGTIVATLKKIKLGSGLVGTQDLVDTTQLNLSSTGGGGGGDLTNIDVDIQPDTNANHSLGTVTKAWKDIYVKDKTTAQIWRIEVDNGILQAVGVP